MQSGTAPAMRATLRIDECRIVSPFFVGTVDSIHSAAVFVSVSAVAGSYNKYDKVDVRNEHSCREWNSTLLSLSQCFTVDTNS